MGDFKPSAERLNGLASEVRLGIENHRFVDRATDQFAGVKELKPLFSHDRRRYAGVVTDITFDYFLIKHWQHFAVLELDEFIELAYSGLGACTEIMPPRMEYVVSKMIEHDWLNTYSTLDGIATAIDHVSKRIRFKNKMAGSIVEVRRNYDQIEDVFLSLFTHLMREVERAAIESRQASK